MTGQTDTAASRPAAPPRSRRWPRIAFALLLLLTIAGAGVVAASTLMLGAATARSSIEAQLSALTGLPVLVAGPSELKLLPRTQISLVNVRVGARSSDSDAVMEIDGVVADLDLWAALWGTAAIERLTLIRPELLSADGFLEGARQNGADTAAAAMDEHGFNPLARYVSAFLSRFGSLRSVEIRDGVFRMAPGPASPGVSNANLRITWPSKTSSARMAGSYVWNGQPTEVRALIASPVDFLAGARSAVDIDLVSPPLTASFDGEATIGGIGQFSGALSVSTPSLTHAIRWLGDARAVLPEIGPLAVEANLDGDERRLNFRDAKVEVDGFAGLGGLEMLLREGERPAIAGTLAFDSLDLNGLADALAPLPQTALDLQRRIPVDFINELNLDIRLSAADGFFGTVPISDLAATVKFTNGVATLDIGDVSLLGGQAQARFTIDSTVRPPAATGAASVSQVGIAPLLAAVGIGGMSLSGTSDVHADYTMPVTNWADLVRRLSVDLSATVRNGTLGGFDPSILTDETAKPLASAIADNALAFQTLRTKLHSDGALVNIESVDAEGAFGLLSAAGSLSVNSKRLDLSGSIAAPAGASTTDRTPSRFRMQGLWPKPELIGGLPTRPM